MILIQAGPADERGFDASVQFARQLDAAGLGVALNPASCPETLSRTGRYDAAPFLFQLRDAARGGVHEGCLERVIVIGAQALSDETLHALRALRLARSCRIQALGAFAGRQDEIGARARLAHAVGREAEVHDLLKMQPRPLREGQIAPMVASVRAPEAARPGGAAGARGPAAGARAVQLFVVIPRDLLEDSAETDLLAHLEALANLPGISCTVVTVGYGREKIRTSRYGALRVLGIAEFSASALAGMADVLAIFGANLPGERMAGFALDLMGRGGVVIDCTDNAALVSVGAPALRGPLGIASLGPFVQGRVLGNRAALAEEIVASAWLRDCSLERLARALDLPLPAPGRPDGNAQASSGAQGRAQAGAQDGAPGGAQDEAQDEAQDGAQGRAQDGARRAGNGERAGTPGGRCIFIPTNGVGLGHAQRCALIAGEMSSIAAAPLGFAAFPSCLGLLQSRGFDCLPLVSRSDAHVQPDAADLVNYLRYRQLFSAADTLVFDGGHVFSSIYRMVLERGLRAVWIRRGLWQAGQLANTPMEREAAFERVIVPLEAFDELNTDYSFGAHVHRVAPVVQRRPMDARRRTALRTALEKRFKRRFSRLIVTMLGGGEAADRSAQMHALAAQVSAHDDWLQLFVIWPGARLAPGLLNWKNSRVVSSRSALDLALAADVLVSAVGYNSFHEVLYHGIPTIFIPQMAAYMDDQERRARAACDRGLAACVGAHELLALERTLHDFLEGDRAAEVRAALQALELPEPGTAHAARLIAEVSG